jgi:hypothetical protein
MDQTLLRTAILSQFDRAKTGNELLELLEVFADKFSELVAE